MEGSDDSVARVDNDVFSRWRQADINDDVVGDPEGVPYFARVCVNDVQPSLVCARYDVPARRGEEGHGGGLLRILCHLLLCSILALQLGAAGRGRQGVLHGDLGGYVDDDGLVFEECGDEEHAGHGLEARRQDRDAD